MYYINYFFIFSIFGHILESFVYSNGQSGILYGWWTPVYGIGILIILGIHSFLDKHFHFKKYLDILILFVSSAIILSIIEALGGYLIELIFDTVFWNYSNFRFHIGKYIALEMALVWGICSILVIYLLKPLIDKFINKIPKIITWSLSLLFILDLILTICFKK